jgi:hypothetical protein
MSSEGPLAYAGAIVGTAATRLRCGSERSIAQMARRSPQLNGCHSPVRAVESSTWVVTVYSTVGV